LAVKATVADAEKASPARPAGYSPWIDPSPVGNIHFGSYISRKIADSQWSS
jgi:hypothetical protein